MKGDTTVKKSVRIFALALALVTVVAVLASCGGTKLSGTYEGKADLFGIAGGSVTYKFSGSDVTITSTGKILTVEKTETKKATYEIKEKDDGSMTITFTYKDDGEKSETLSFKQDKENKTITIGGVTYTKK